MHRKEYRCELKCYFNNVNVVRFPIVLHLKFDLGVNLIVFKKVYKENNCITLKLTFISLAPFFSTNTY
jgi:hypothetical protein